jgi:hypothetical protein
MHYELWEYRTRNLVNTYASEAEALAMVRTLLAAGWSPDELSLGLEFDEHEPQDLELSPVLEGAELAARVLSADLEEKPRSA